MIDDYFFCFCFILLLVVLLLGVWIVQLVMVVYVEVGWFGDLVSWCFVEYQQDWGLEWMWVDQVYVVGIDGQGVKIGEMDFGFDLSYLDIFVLCYQLVMVSGIYVDGMLFSVSGVMNGNNDFYGIYVGGIFGVLCDGVGMYGVVYVVQVYVVNINQNDSFLFGLMFDLNYFKVVYQVLVDVGVWVINNSWGSQFKDVSYEIFDGLYVVYVQYYGCFIWLDVVVGVFCQGVINVFSVGNSGYVNVSVCFVLFYFQLDLEGYWLVVFGFDQQNGQCYNCCGIVKYWCIIMFGCLINSIMFGGGYVNKFGISMVVFYVIGVLVLVMQCYLYLNNEQVLQVLLIIVIQFDGMLIGVFIDIVGWGVLDFGWVMYGFG